MAYVKDSVHWMILTLGRRLGWNIRKGVIPCGLTGSLNDIEERRSKSSIDPLRREEIK